MRCLALSFAVVVLAVSPPARAQANPHCQAVPKTFAAMHGCFRPLLVFSPASGDARLHRQAALLDADADDMMDRFVLFTPISPDSRRAGTPVDSPWTVLPQPQIDQIRARFHIPAGQFAVLLLDEDGSVMLRSANPVNPSRLNALIDRTPLRQAEMRRPGAN